ncbi:zinc dependent phospholipase C [Clostridium homopropionicum DSM 5847]|uniref:Phospholipase C n=1 Tax=Clostridium homopropionicum DSM 5847 TaxID=1121318 RepID=A0A0L6ZEG9_9CLOT|nr:zinc dependent phospholipase C family protein [Clostridium homopropionicum]KOA21370.1 zinc dependent phospholipase C [Clostridium homopropionicum DSM 5847]SFG12086.1 phospholipase C [Clostridium homopropionicum]
MKTKTERVFGKTARKFMIIINPIKKLLINTHCLAHRYINHKAFELLKKEGFIDEYNCLSKYINNIDAGATWADQDFKSTNHFYHFSERKGLYGFSNALTECQSYYELSLKYLELGDLPLSCFYFGAACHLIQDTTVPHHVNNKLLKNHRKFELWIIEKILLGHHFEAKKGIKRFNSIKEYIDNNATIANQAYYKYCNIKNREDRYLKVACMIIQEAQISTAGFMIDYCKHLKRKVEC